MGPHSHIRVQSSGSQLMGAIITASPLSSCCSGRQQRGGVTDHLQERRNHWAGMTGRLVVFVLCVAKWTETGSEEKAIKHLRPGTEPHTLSLSYLILGQACGSYNFAEENTGLAGSCKIGGDINLSICTCVFIVFARQMICTAIYIIPNECARIHNILRTYTMYLSVAAAALLINHRFLHSLYLPASDKSFSFFLFGAPPAKRDDAKKLNTHNWWKLYTYSYICMHALYQVSRVCNLSPA